MTRQQELNKDLNDLKLKGKNLIKCKRNKCKYNTRKTTKLNKKNENVYQNLQDNTIELIMARHFEQK